MNPLELKFPSIQEYKYFVDAEIKGLIDQLFTVEKRGKQDGAGIMIQLKERLKNLFSL